MSMKKQFAFAAAALATAITAAVPASAAIPVIDPTAIARIREVASTASQQLASVRRQVQQVTNIGNTIGHGGPGEIASVLAQSGIVFDGANGLLRDVNSIANTGSQLNSAFRNLQIAGESAINLGKIGNLNEGRQAAARIFYYGGRAKMTVESIRQLRERRNFALRETAVTSYGAATSFKSDLQQTQKMAGQLSVQAAQSTDLRSDLQVNTATLLAMYAELQKQTAIQAQLLELDSSRTLAADATAKRN